MMNECETFVLPDIVLYSLTKEQKQAFFIERMSRLFKHHTISSESFNKMMIAINYMPDSVTKIEDFPFIPVRLFKLFELLSVPKNLIVKTMTSSGTTGQAVSKIFLDRQTALSQTKTLSKIVSTYVGSSRAPMIIIDSEATIKNRNKFSARAAGITGFSIFASKRIFALNDDMSLNIPLIENFINENSTKTIMIFGFTYIIYQHFIKELSQSGLKLNLSNAVLFHGGGWKKMINEKIDNNTFKNNLYSLSGIERVHDYYGMVEQTGTIYVECEFGYMHTSEYSDIVVRNPFDFSVCKNKQQGIIQLLSLLPISYPGQSLLTEDVGEIFGEDSCECGRMGKYFKIHGRLKNAEIRGCSDTYGENFKRS